MLTTATTLVTLICVLVTVAFFTLFERKVLSYSQMRKGPNKVSFTGITQPLADALKLFSKEMIWPLTSNPLAYLLAPLSSLIISLLLWQVFPSNIFSLSWGVLLFLSISSLNVYGTLIAGWSSNSKYALIGAIRAAAQTISYEVSLALILLSVLLFFMTLCFKDITYPAIILLFPLAFMWFASCAAETNRAPFDFAEGESELVSGFNVEYSAVGFALIFLAEYANIILMSMITAILFFFPQNALKTIILCFCFIWIRSTFPRFRYDRLMSLAWKTFLPFSLSLMMLLTGFQGLIC